MCLVTSERLKGPPLPGPFFISGVAPARIPMPRIELIGPTKRLWIEACHMDFVEFDDGDRTFTCRAASSPATPDTVWWWISVTGESQRYAAFRAQKGDALANLRPRVLAYYAGLRAARERPPEVRAHWTQRGRKPGGAAATPPQETGTAL